jgi:hypothetical protein
MLLCWLLFALLFWIGAWHKPFSSHDFYSWVYAERCTVAEILTLKDTGIGHPPGYHLCQKLVQTAAPFYHPALVRLANFVFGSVFVLVLTSLVGRRPGFTLFCCGIAVSATTLNTFMFSRMWGLVCLIALLLIAAGERLSRRWTRRRALVIVGLVLLGFTADFSFVLLLPYATMALLTGLRRPERPAHLLLGSGVAAVVLALGIHALNGAGAAAAVKGLVHDLTRAAFSIGAILFNYWFVETFALALAVFFAVLLARRRGLRLAIPLLAALLLLAGALVEAELLRARHAILPLAGLGLLAAWSRRHWPFFDIRQADDRLITGVGGALLILLTANHFFWTDLLQTRFFLALFPLLVLLLARRLPAAARNTLALLMIVSGLMYTASNGLSYSYPPPAVTGGGPVVFTTVNSYSTHYLRCDALRGEEAYILDDLMFERSCRVCRMGTDQVPFDQMERYLLVWLVLHDPLEAVPATHVPIGEEPHLSRLDRLQFAALTPLRTHYYVVSEFRRAETADGGA